MEEKWKIVKAIDESTSFNPDVLTSHERINLDFSSLQLEEKRREIFPRKLDSVEVEKGNV